MEVRLFINYNTTTRFPYLLGLENLIVRRPTLLMAMAAEEDALLACLLDMGFEESRAQHGIACVGANGLDAVLRLLLEPTPWAADTEGVFDLVGSPMQSRPSKVPIGVSLLVSSPVAQPSGSSSSSSSLAPATIVDRMPSGSSASSASAPADSWKEGRLSDASVAAPSSLRAAVLAVPTVPRTLLAHSSADQPSPENPCLPADVEEDDSPLSQLLHAKRPSPARESDTPPSQPFYAAASISSKRRRMGEPRNVSLAFKVAQDESRRARQTQAALQNTLAKVREPMEALAASQATSFKSL